jgi:hypothetical protein
MMIPTTTTLEQKVFLKGFQRFEILADGNLDITFKRFSIHRQFKVPLWQIILTPERITTRPTGAIVGSVIFGLLTLGTLIGMVIAQDMGTALALLAPATFLGALLTACLCKLQTESIDGVSFYFRNGGQMHLWFEKPDAKTFQNFCDTLTKKTEEACQSHPFNPAVQSLAGEIAELNRLREKGVVSEIEFEQAKTKLLEGSSNHRIGF